MKLLTTILVTLLVLLSSTYTAKVVRVSFTVLTDNKEQIRIRLEDTFYEVFGIIEIYSCMNLQHVVRHTKKKTHAQKAHLVFADTKANAREEMTE